VACLACRNNGSRLYGKPLQNLDIDQNLSILDYILLELKNLDEINEIVLAISEGPDNLIYKSYAERYGIKYVIGSEEDVLGRLIDACSFVSGTDIFRMTTESPFIFYEIIAEGWASHIKCEADLTTLDGVPDGSGIEIIKLDAYKKSWKKGQDRHRSEYCSLYIRENKDQFRINYLSPPKELLRTDIRLTVDYPEDLILCRLVYSNFKKYAPLIPVREIIKFLDNHPATKGLVSKYIDDGLRTMYL